ncbi:hypothetical protein [Vibrio splendidus]|uniref:hypothetical protein n=1 Tax=Vibrio splendidus TaxID=29497 RepID=UPI0002DE154B|nr:hypothetical protein [Vibrio splendidus]OED73724.1 hypothetical protein A144_09670 [Vibrio splendidus ZF-90]OEF21652.1 hypothetical protein A145_08065 [Vibrio splendidus 5S-101]PTP35182.1 hypothetical protein CWN95_10205 [Vibrio splendidus]
MYLEPFRVLYNKLPFFEFAVRMLLFVWNPKIDEDLRKDGIRCALWDIFLSTSLMAVSVILLDAIFGTSFKKLLSILKFELSIFLEFGYFAFSYTALLFLISVGFVSAIKLARKDRTINVVKMSFLASLQFARLYSLIMFLFFPIVLLVLDAAITKPDSVRYLVDKSIWISWGIMAFFIWLYTRCLVNPVRHYLGVRNWWLAPVVIIYTFSPMFFTSYVPTVFDFSIHHANLELIHKEKLGTNMCK